MEGDSRTYQRKLWLGSVPLRAKNCFLMFWGNLLCFSFCPLSPVLPLGITEESLAPFSFNLRSRYLHTLMRFPWAFLTQGWTAPSLSAFSHMCNTPIPSSPLQIFSGLSPVRPHLFCSGESTVGPCTPDMASPCWAEGKGHFPGSTGNIMPNAAHNITGLLCGQGTFLDHVQ